MNIAWLVLAIGAAVWTGGCVVRALWPGGRGMTLVILKVALALAVGWGVMAAHYVIWRVACGELGWAYRVADCLVIPALAWWGMRWRLRALGAHEAADLARGRVSYFEWVLLAAGLAAATGGLAVTAGQLWYEPLGQWDGWAIWNLKARFLYRGDEGAWAGILSREIWFSHPDYPLLLPASIARLWTYLGQETTLAPQLTGLGYTALVMLLLFASLNWLCGPAHGCAGVFLLAGSESFLYIGGAQYADVPLSLYMLAAVALVAIAQRVERGRRALLVLAGVMAGCGAMMKNEGLVMAVALLAGVVLAGRWGRDKRRWMVALLAAGMLPGLMATSTQKVFLSGESYMTADQPSEDAAIRKLTDGSRYRMVAGWWWRWNFTLREWKPVDRWDVSIPVPTRPALALLLAVAVIWRFGAEARDRFAVVAGLVAIAMLMAAYFVVYLLIPYDLYTILETSAERLQLHYWPSLVFVVLLGSGGREAMECDTASAGDRPQ